jgi:hypothetical protein
VIGGHHLTSSRSGTRPASKTGMKHHSSLCFVAAIARVLARAVAFAFVVTAVSCNDDEGADRHGTHGNWRAGPEDDGRQERHIPGSRHE